SSNQMSIPKRAMVAFGCNSKLVLGVENEFNSRLFSGMQFRERSPEKAGVGGSIPSLATMFSTRRSGNRCENHSVS
ncbi:MAG TPA: hypothetical protein VH640_31880, partial [Bryobacteraceae bacterium]